MKILTWNINGVRASKLPLKTVFDGLDADIICLQETKITRDMLDEKTAIVDGYSSYYSFSNTRTGYSGVATYVRDDSTPVKAEEGLSGRLRGDEEAAIGHYGDHSDFTEEELDGLDNEGRTMITLHNIKWGVEEQRLLAVINVYCPRADPEREDRKAFKARFYQLLQIRAQTLLTSGCHVIILGDVNTAHKRNDHCDPEDQDDFVKNPGRQWLDQLLWTPPVKSSDGSDQNQTEKQEKSLIETYQEMTEESSDHLFVDTFRYFYPNKTNIYTCWNTMKGCRETNFGTRIDYILADKRLAVDMCTDCVILGEVMGSDHCPVKATLTCPLTPAKRLPPLCTRNFPEFAGIQTKLSAFFTKGTKRPHLESPKKQDVKNSSSINSQIQNPSEKQPPLVKSSTLPPPAKKLKIEKQTSGKKQSSLANFFGKPSNKSLTSSVKDQEKPDKPKQTESAPTALVTPTVSADLTETKKVENQSKDSLEKPKVASAAWKNLLKGPPPAPRCKGHGEPCLLRTVKKEESLNKGRQFYVCCRPDGHKSDPQARCDHFEWVDKKKKPPQMSKSK